MSIQDDAFEVESLNIGEKSYLFAQDTDPALGDHQDLPDSSICLAPSGIFQKAGQNWIRVTDPQGLGSGIDAYTKAQMDAFLAAKSNTGHGHAITEVFNLTQVLNGKADTTHVHTNQDIIDALGYNPAQVNSDWNAVSGVARILNRPATVVTSVNGGSGAVVISSITGNAGTATTLQTSRTISLSGAVTGTGSFNGGANLGIATTLANSGAVAGTYRSVTVTAKGIVTAGSNPTTLAGYGITDAVSSSLLGANSGVATLDASGKINTAQLPGLAITNTFVCATEVAMLAIGPADVGDIAVRTDINKSFILTALPGSALANWQELLTAPDLVTSVNGKIGAITLSSSDITGFSAVAYSGAYSDLTGTPVIPAAQVNSDWLAASGVAQILNKPTTLAGYGITDAASSTHNHDATYAPIVHNHDTSYVLKNASITPGFKPKVAYDAKGLVTSGADLLAADIPVLDWSKITTGKPTTLAGYGITDGAPLTHIHPNATTSIAGFQSAADKTKLDSLANYVHPLSGVSAGTYKSVTVNGEGHIVAGTNPTSLAGYGITDAIPTSMMGANSGVATLDAAGKLSLTQVPSIAVTDTFVVANQSAQLTLNAEVGDVCIRTDLNKTYILRITPASAFGNWQELAFPTGSVSSVNGQTGAVSITDITGNAGTANKLFTARSMTMSGDVSSIGNTFDGTANVGFTTTLSSTGVVAGTYTKITCDAKGRVTSATSLSGADVTGALGYTPLNSSGGSIAGSLSVGGSFSAAGAVSLTAGLLTPSITGLATSGITDPAGAISKGFADATYVLRRSGVHIQSVSSSVVARNGTTTMTFNNTTPVATSGTEIWGLSITPTAAANSIRITGSFTWVHSSSKHMFAAHVFRDTTYVGTVMKSTTGNYIDNMSINLVDNPPGVAAYRYSVRVAASGSGTWYINRAATSYWNGGLDNTTISLIEVQA